MTPTFDSDGYPTEGTLEAIREWPYDNLPGLVAFVCDAWRYADYAKASGRTLELHTVGWSGNESLIEALQQNAMFWGLCWERSERGGHFWFELPDSLAK
jgi:hypothetical protein